MSAAMLVQALGWALISFVWQGALVALGLACVLQCVPARQARLRYALACSALGLCLALPLMQVVHTLSLGAPGQAVSLMRPAAASAVREGGVAAGPVFIAWLGPHLPMLVCLWAATVALLMARHAHGLWWVRSLIRDARLPAPATLQRQAARLARAMGLDRDVRVVLTERLSTPVTAGWWKPVVLVPASLASGMPADLLDALIAHELAHIRRHDYLVNLLQTVAETLLFYHPAVWWISRVIRIEREHVADDLAADVLGEPRRLALALSELEKCQPASHQLLQASHGGKLMFRIQRLVRPQARPRTSGVAVAALTIAVACAALAARAQVVPAAPVATAALEFDGDSCARPQWPEASLRNGEQGETKLALLVGTDGKVKNSHITRSAGFRDLDKAVMVAYQTCRAKTAPAQDTWVSVNYVWKAGAGGNTAPLTVSGHALPEVRVESKPILREGRPMMSIRVSPGAVDYKTCAGPVYPQAARSERRQGTVSLNFLVEADGRVTDSAIVKSSGSADLDEAARTALSQCHFYPTVRDGQAVADWKPLQYVWSLD